MVSKKYSLLAALCCLLTSFAFSQNTTTTTTVRSGGGYDVTDSSLIPERRMAQHTEFMNGTYDFPAKPRNQWEVGIKGGLSSVAGDVRAWLPTFGGGIHVRKAFGYIFSARLEYNYLTSKGLNYSKGIITNNPAWEDNYSSDELVFYNYKTKIQELGLQGLVTLNNIRFHKAKTGMNFYFGGGLAGVIYDPKINTLNESGDPYTADFANISGSNYKDRKETLKALKDVLDDSWETRGEGDPLQPKIGGKPFKPGFSAIAGVQFKLSPRINLAIEDKFTSVKTDLLDGQQWQQHPGNDPAQSRDYDSYNFLSVGLNFNLGAKSVEPLWWLNPLDYAYSEIRNPRLMRLPKPVLPDADGDGVTDQFDLEQTPEGCPVDTHGVSRDTDGDGVPDCKDKELVTPTICQPVDADGVGKCPCPDSTCFDKYMVKSDCSQKLGALPSVSFKSGSNSLSSDAKAVLATVAALMRNNPECKVVVIGYCSSSKKEQQLSWDHVNKVINHMVENEGISADRFIFQYGQEGGDCNTVDLRGAATGEEGPAQVAPPHPNLRKK